MRRRRRRRFSHYTRLCSNWRMRRRRSIGRRRPRSGSGSRTGAATRSRTCRVAWRNGCSWQRRWCTSPTCWCMPWLFLRTLRQHWKMLIWSWCLEMIRCPSNAPLHSLLYHCRSEIVCDNFVGRLMRRSHNPSASKALAESVQWVNLPLSKDILQAALSMATGKPEIFHFLLRNCCVFSGLICARTIWKLYDFMQISEADT